MAWRAKKQEGRYFSQEMLTGNLKSKHLITIEIDLCNHAIIDMSPRDEWREEYNFVEWARAFSAGYGNRRRRMKRRRRSASQTPPSLRKKNQLRRDIYDLCKWHPKESHVMVSCSGVYFLGGISFRLGLWKV
ncbi:hypothetical protein OIU74_003286 [Salix koriyanagi]|uniref:Uncharacterized protein n=1 Tax=Salix koriyanagi TaxID=2511006 RepID=A0A9Q0UXF8_9ROSI|nr:hypothetical protein OIU74_003286 [Salix koriyanagi]